MKLPWVDDGRQAERIGEREEEVGCRWKQRKDGVVGRRSSESPRDDLGKLSEREGCLARWSWMKDPLGFRRSLL